MQDQTPPETEAPQPEQAPAPTAPVPETKPQENVPVETPQELPPEAPTVPPQPPKSDFRAKVVEAKRKKFEARLEKVINLARSKGKITTNLKLS